MGRMLSFAGRNRPRRNDSTRPLIENNNNNDIQDGYDQAVNGYDNPYAQNIFNNQEEQHLRRVEEIKPEELAEVLDVAPDANASNADLIQRCVLHHLPKPPADLNQNLQQHLLDVQETVHNELGRLGPLLESMGLMGCLIDYFQRQIFDHLNDLLQNISSSHSSFVLMKWVLHTNLSQELLGHTERGQKWVLKAKEKVLKNVQNNIREFLKKILQHERSQDGCDGEEAFIQLHVDTIQCINAPIKEAQQISELSEDVKLVCFQELLMFLRSYTAEQKEILGKKAKMDKPETMHFFKTLNTCKELKQHVQTKCDKGKDNIESLLKETLAVLEEMETFTLKLLLKIVADIAERYLKNYFKTQSKQFLLLLAVKTYFPKLLWCQDVQKTVMDEAYELIIHIYLKHLVRTSQKKLKKCWSPNVVETVIDDAELLHETISELAPGVQQWSLRLLKIRELLECKDTDSVKLTVASVQNERLTWSYEDLELLLRWCGLSKWQVTEVLDAIPGHQPKPKPWYSCFICC